MNSLDVPLKQGTIVVMRKKEIKPQFHGLEYRLQVTMGGFGLNNATSGKALFCRDMSEMFEGLPFQTYRFEGYQIDREETREVWQRIASLPLDTFDGLKDFFSLVERGDISQEFGRYIFTTHSLIKSLGDKAF